MFVVHTHPVYQRRSRRVPSYDPFGFERPIYSLGPEPTLGDPVQLARARYLHALEEQQAAREAYAVHQLRAFQDEATAFLQQQQQQQQQRRRQAANEEARLRAERARREQLIQARREEQLRRRRLREVQEHEFSQALMLAFELASQGEPSHVEHAPAPPACAYAQVHRRKVVMPVPAVAPTLPSAVPVRHAPSRPVSAFQPRVRFSAAESPARAPAPALSRPAATPVTLKSALKPSAPPAPIRIGIRESQAGPSSSSSASAPAPPAAPARIPIRESKGKASSQVRINAVTAPAPHSLAPADAIAALMLLEADLDALTPAVTPVPLLRHQLSGILESVDAIESGGNDAVREVRRALVRRIEEALVAVEQGDAVPAAPQRAVGITINEPSLTRVEVSTNAQSAASAAVESAAPSETNVVEGIEVAPAAEEAASPATTHDVAPVLEGYVVDDFLDPMRAAPSPPPASPMQCAIPQPAAPAPVVELAAAVEGDQVTTSADEEPVVTTDEDLVSVNDENLAAATDEEPVATPALPNDDVVSVDAASSGVDLVSSPTLPASAAQPAVSPTADLSSPAAAAEPTSPAVTDPDDPASPTPDETPLTASYPPAQTFAAPSHPAVDTGSDGEWERPGSSGSEGVKSDYEVV